MRRPYAQPQFLPNSAWLPTKFRAPAELQVHIRIGVARGSDGWQRLTVCKAHDGIITHAQTIPSTHCTTPSGHDHAI